MSDTSPRAALRLEEAGRTASSISPKNMALTAAEKQKRYREKRKSDPERDAAYRVKHKERNAKRKVISQMTGREARQVRRDWKKRSKACRDRRKNVSRLISVTPPATPPNEPVILQPIQPSGNVKRGRRVIARNRQATVRQNKRLLKEIEVLKYKLQKSKSRSERYKKRYQRFCETNENTTQPLPSTPKSKAVRELTDSVGKMLSPTSLKKLRKSSAVKTLTFHNVIINELQKSDKKKKRCISDLIIGQLARKYRLLSLASKAVGLATRRRKVLIRHKRESKIRFLVQEFFLCDDVSRASSGIKETITRKKIKMQKRYLTCSLKKLHAKFLQSSSVKISYAHFARLRPFFVMKQVVDKRNTCLCIHHENMNLLSTCLKNLGLLESNDTHKLVQNIVCNKNDFQCMHNKCDKCKDMTMAFELNHPEVNFKQEVQWEQWSSVKELRSVKGREKLSTRTKKIVKCGTIEEMINYFNDKLKRFKTHIYNVKIQHLSYKTCKENLDQNSVLIHIDFSENFNCKYHQEVQSFHFAGSREQATIHTGVLYLKEKQPSTFATISDSLEHGPHAIWAHLTPILDYLLEHHALVKTLHFFSDGPTTQYRQKNNFFLFCQEMVSRGFQATWSFFEAGHGKGAADGVGGALKRTANQYVADGGDIPTPKMLFDTLKEIDSEILLFFINKSDVENKLSLIPSGIKQVRGTMKLHQIVMRTATELSYREVSCFCNKNIFCRNRLCSCKCNWRTAMLVEDGEPQKAREQTSATTPLTESSEEDEDVPLQDESSDCGSDIFHPDNDEPILHETDYSQIKAGAHVLVALTGGSRNATKFKYAAVCLNRIDDADGNVPVRFMKVVGEKRSLFKMDEDDEADIDYTQILGMLPNPKIVVKGNRVFYKFPGPVEVNES